MSNVATLLNLLTVEDLGQNQLIASAYAAATAPSPSETILTSLSGHSRLAKAAAISHRSDVIDRGYMIEHTRRPDGHERRHLTTWPQLDRLDLPSGTNTMIRKPDRKPTHVGRLTCPDLRGHNFLPYAS